MAIFLTSRDIYNPQGTIAYPITNLPSASLKLCAGTSRFNCKSDQWLIMQIKEGTGPVQGLYGHARLLQEWMGLVLRIIERKITTNRCRSESHDMGRTWAVSESVTIAEGRRCDPYEPASEVTRLTDWNTPQMSAYPQHNQPLWFLCPDFITLGVP